MPLNRSRFPEIIWVGGRASTCHGKPAVRSTFIGCLPESRARRVHTSGYFKRYGTVMKSLKSASPVMAATCCIVAIASCRGGRGPRPVTGLAGTVLEQPSKAVEFTLTDQHGSTFRMADTRGKVVLMSFLQTHGGDAEAAEVKAVDDLLGADIDHVVLVSVTLDPERDTPVVLAAYSKQFGLFDVWHFVGGSPKDVKAVWFDYGVAVSVFKTTAGFPGFLSARYSRARRMGSLMASNEAGFSK